MIRYEAQLEEFKTKGYFTMADRVESTEFAAASGKRKKKVKSTDATARQPAMMCASGNVDG